MLDCENAEIIDKIAKNSAFEVIKHIEGKMITTWLKIPFSLLLMALKNCVTDIVFVSINTNLAFCSGLFSEFSNKTKIKINLCYFGMKNYIGFLDPFVKNIKSLGVESKKFDGKWSTLKYHWCAKLTDDSKTFEANKIRENYKKIYNVSMIIGTIARTERYSREFVDLIVKNLIKMKIYFIFMQRKMRSIYLKNTQVIC